MKKTIIAMLVIALSLGGATAAFATHKPGHPAKPAKAQGKAKGKSKQKSKPAKIQICHRTLSETNPTRTIRISERAWKAHEAHGDTRGACEQDSGQPAGFTRMETQLTAVAGATGSGSAVVDVRVGKKSARVCYTLMVSGVDATAAHIHTFTDVTLGGTNFAANSIVVPLKTPNSNGVARGCAKVSIAVGQALINNTSNFYVNVHSAAFPAGQVQGTLALA
jgi:CHRD domain